MSYATSAAYIIEIEEWRQQQEAELRAPDGWLSITGLFELKEGYQTIGSNPQSDIRLPDSALDHLGIIKFREGKARLLVATDEVVLIDGQPARNAELVDNGDRKRPTLVTVGSITFFVHKFGNQYGIRVKDRNNPAISSFSGREWYAIKPEYRVQGRYLPYATPQAIPVKSVLNTNTNYNSVGLVEFELHAHKLSFLATEIGVPNWLHIVFRDATAGVETYGASRFLSVEVDDMGQALLDFNKAYNPPCAFSSYVTCPLPPRQNILPVAIAAGERFPHARIAANPQVTPKVANVAP